MENEKREERRNERGMGIIEKRERKNLRNTLIWTERQKLSVDSQSAQDTDSSQLKCHVLYFEHIFTE